MSFLPDWLTGYDSANADAAAAADAKLREINASEAPLYGPEWYAQVQQDYANQAPIGEEAQRAAVDQAFTDSLDASANSITGGIGNFLKVLLAPAWALIKSVPIWVWLLAAFGVFLWLGGWKLIGRRLKIA